MAMNSVSKASAMLHVNANPQATTALPHDNTPNDVDHRTRKRQKRIIYAESAAASFQTEAPATTPLPPPLQKELCEPVFDRCDNGVGLRQKVAKARENKKKNPNPEDSYESFKTKEKKNCTTNHLGSVQLEAETVGFAMSLHFECKECKHKVSVESQKVLPHFFSGKENSHYLYWVNYLIVMLMHQMGCGMYHAQMLAVF
eukprot:scaffold16571_cov76-Attheya_sp.AAC.4